MYVNISKKQNNNEIQNLISDLDEVADITRKDNMSILTLITDVDKSSQVLATVFRVFSERNIAVEMLSQGASKVNISFILKSDKLEEAILHLHSCFFEEQCAVPMTNTSAEEKKEEVGI